MRSVTLVLLMIPAIATPAMSEVYTLRPDGTGDFETIQQAIDATIDGDIILLEDGVYVGEGNRDLDFSGKAIRVTSQSGNPGLCALDCQGLSSDPHRAVHFSSGEQVGTVLFGLTITNGYLEGYDMEYSGAGVFCSNGSSPTIEHCVFVANESHDYHGGALACYDHSSPTLISCQFVRNRAAFGGGASFREYSHPILTDCQFSENEATHGGGVGAWDSEVQFQECVFMSNSATGKGGGLHVSLCGPSLIGCAFVSNSADFGAAIDSYGSLISGSYCTISHNAAATSGGGISCRASSTITLSNCIIAFSVNGEGVACVEGGGVVQLSCCDAFGNAEGDYVGCIEDQAGQAGNISLDPLFCAPDIGDFTLYVDSPCAPFSEPNPECDLIGALPVECEPTPITGCSWGAIKGMFRSGD